MNYPKIIIPPLSRLAQICSFSITLSAIALFSADLAQAGRFTPTIKPSRPVYPFPGVTNEVTPQCKALMTSIKDMIYVNMNHTTLNNIRGNESGGYSEAFLSVNNGVASGSGRRLLSDRYVPPTPIPVDLSIPPENRIPTVQISTQPFDIKQSEQMSYSIDLATAKITLQDTKRQITSCPGGKFAVFSTATSVEMFSFSPGPLPPN
jgi:hypothetical protein